MRWQIVTSLLGIIICLFSFTMIPPICVDLLYGQDVFMSFVFAFLAIFLFGLMLAMLAGDTEIVLRRTEGMMVIALSWILLALLSALPFLFGAVDVPVIDAIFESVSGLTTTGTAVFHALDTLPRAVIYYRQQLELVGGMGIIVFATIILPFLGVGGMQIYQGEIGGPVKNKKWLPKMQETLGAFLGIYLSMLFLCVCGYCLGGMPLFDALCEAFGTVSTGGFSIHDTSFAAYHNVFIQLTCMVFMLLSGLNFTYHFYAVTRKDWRIYTTHFESKVFFQIMAVVGLIVFTVIIWAHVYPSILASMVRVGFTVISMATTTGFANTDFASWPSFLPVLMLFLAMIGGCSGSTTGGIKILRMLLVFREGVTELKRMMHPQAIFSVDHAKEEIPSTVLDSVRGFLSIFILVYLFMLLALMLSGLNFYDAFVSVTTCLSNVGASIGNMANGFTHLGAFSKILLVLCMLAGRLEVMALVIICMPCFWRT